MLVSGEDKNNSTFFKETVKNTEKDKLVKFMVYENL